MSLSEIESLRTFFLQLDPAILNQPIKFNSASIQHNPAKFVSQAFTLMDEGVATRIENMYIVKLRELKAAIIAQSQV